MIHKKSHVFVAWKLMKYKKITSKCVSKITTFVFFDTGKYFDVSSLFSVHKPVAISAVLKYSNITILQFL